MKYLIDETTLTSMANSVREKSGKTGLIKVEDMATEITSIPVGEDLSTQLDAQDEIIAELQEAVKNKTSGGGKITTEVKSLYNGGLAPGNIHNFKLEPNKMYLFVAQPYGPSQVDSSFYVSRLIVTGENSINDIPLSWLKSSMMSHYSIAKDGLDITITGEGTSVWWIMSFTEIPISFEKYLTNTLAGSASVSINVPNPAKNYLFLNENTNAKGELDIYVVTRGVESATSSSNLKARLLLTGSTYTSNQTVSSTNSNTLKCQNSSGVSTRYGLVEL